jgi:glycosyltransferase involved in cell wall biosynthesis
MNQDPVVSVVIPTYNSAATIIQAIESVINQTLKGCEIIVVDDGSTDSTRMVLDSYIKTGMITYLFQENAGCGAARNYGIAQARGTYVAFLDSDDYFHVEKLERQVKMFRERPETVVCYTDAYEIDPFNAMITEVRQTTAGTLRSGHVLPALALRNFITLSSAMVRTLTMKEYPFDASRELMMFADYDLWLRLAAVGEFHAISIPLTFYRTRLPITRIQKRDNHRKVATVFAHCFATSTRKTRGWYAAGYVISITKYVFHATLQAVGL